MSVLKAAAVEVGLDPDKLEEALSQQTHTSTVQQQYQEARSHGINGIPAFTIGKYLFTGAHPYEFFKQVIDKVIAENEAEDQ